MGVDGRSAVFAVEAEQGQPAKGFAAVRFARLIDEENENDPAPVPGFEDVPNLAAIVSLAAKLRESTQG